jgi:Bacterial protein of unknown function (DUF922)
MPSQLIGLMRRLTWDDFTREEDVPPPGPGESAQAAATKTDVPDIAVSFRTVLGSVPPKVRIDDNLTVKIVFDAKASWRAVWVKDRPQAERDWLLQHEQGHYNIAALMARDFFLDVMPLKGKVYGKQKDALDEISKLKSSTLSKIDPLQTRYDDDTKHGSDQAVQNRWTGMINTAFTSTRTPPATAADGVPLKARLLDVLRAGGIVVP